MTRSLSLHQLTVMDAGPTGVVEIAAEVGVGQVCVFVRSAKRPNVHYPVIETDAMRRDVLARMDGTGVRVHNVEVFMVRPDTAAGDFDADLAMGEALGARRLTALIVDSDEGRAFDAFCGLCERAAAHRLDVQIEFHAFSHLTTLVAARRFLARGRPANASLAVDALHLYRNDGGIAGLRDGDRTPIGYAQICDGPLTIDPEQAFAEAIGDRLAPGEGAFDLRGFVDALPETIVVDVEAPANRLKAQGWSPLDRARHMVAAARRYIPDAGAP